MDRTELLERNVGTPDSLLACPTSTSKSIWPHPMSAFLPSWTRFFSQAVLKSRFLTSQVWICPILHIHTATTMSHYSPGIPECSLFPWVHSCLSNPCPTPWHTLLWLLIVFQINSKLLATAYKALSVLVLAFFSNLISSARVDSSSPILQRTRVHLETFTHAASSARNIFLLLTSLLGILLWASS